MLCTYVSYQRRAPIPILLYVPRQTLRGAPGQILRGANPKFSSGGAATVTRLGEDRGHARSEWHCAGHRHVLSRSHSRVCYSLNGMMGNRRYIVV